MNSYFIKLGGSLITDKSVPRHVRQEALIQIAEELADLYHEQPNATWLVGNGAGSFGHYTVQAVDYKQAPDDEKRVAAVRQSVRDLNAMVVATLKNAGVPAISLPPHSFMYEKQGEVVCDNQQFLDYLQHGRVPIIYGDVIKTDTATRIISTEEVLAVIGNQWGQKLTACIYVSGVDGVLDKHGHTVPVLRRDDRLHVHNNQSDYDVTGGMAQKVSAGFEALAYANHVYIVNGKNRGHLTKAVHLKDIGTQLQA